MKASRKLHPHNLQLHSMEPSCVPHISRPFLIVHVLHRKKVGDTFYHTSEPGVAAPEAYAYCLTVHLCKNNDRHDLFAKEDRCALYRVRASLIENRVHDHLFQKFSRQHRVLHLRLALYLPSVRLSKYLLLLHRLLVLDLCLQYEERMFRQSFWQSTN